MTHPLVSINKLFFSYKGDSVIKDLSLALFPGEVVALVGASGVGKTTLLKIIAGLLSGYSGMITKQGSLAYMAQEDVLLPWRTVYENIMLPFELGKKRRDNKKIEAHLSLFGLKLIYQKYPHELSGGQKRSVCCARMLLQDTAILLFDEPFTAIDVHLRKTFFTPFRQKACEGKTLFFVTHDFRDAYALADRILFLSEGALCKEWHIHETMRSCQTTEIRVLQEIQKTFHSEGYVV